MLPPMPAQAAEAGLTMAAVLRHLVSGAATTAGLPPLPAPEDNGPLPGLCRRHPPAGDRDAHRRRVGGLWRATRLTRMLMEMMTRWKPQRLGKRLMARVRMVARATMRRLIRRTWCPGVERIPDDMLLSWEDLKDLPGEEAGTSTLCQVICCVL